MGRNKAALFELIRDPGVNQKSMPVAQQSRQISGPRLDALREAAPKETSPREVGPREGVSREAAREPLAIAREPKPRVVLSTSPRVEPAGQGAAEVGGGGGSLGSGGSGGAGRGARTGLERALKLDFAKNFSVSTSVVFVGLAGLILLVVIVAATAYSRGQAKAEQAARAEMERAGVRDPLRGDIPLNPSILPNEPGSQAGMQAPVQPVRPVVQPQSRPAAPAGPLADTREMGLNYCVAASMLPKEEAERAARFLSENGVPAAAVWVESDAGPAKNRPAYRVYILKGLSGSDVNRRAPARTDLEAELSRLGKIWQRDHRGNVNFAQTYWEKKR